MLPLTLQVEILWERTALTAEAWPVRCTLSVPGDSYKPNNDVEKVIRK